MMDLFVAAFGLGLVFNAAPGVVFAESVRRGLSGGYAAALAVQIGSLLGDLTWAVLGLAGAAVLFTVPAVEKPLALGGAALLLGMAVQALRDAKRPMPVFAPAAGVDRSALGAGAALSLSNPLNITYWAGLGGTIAALGVGTPRAEAFAVFLLGFMASSVLWCFLCAGVIAGARKFIGPRLWVALHAVCALGLGTFALVSVHRCLGP